jgi:hypothetical protein
MQAKDVCIQCGVELEKSDSTLCKKCKIEQNLKEIDELIKEKYIKDLEDFKDFVEKNYESNRFKFCEGSLL